MTVSQLPLPTTTLVHQLDQRQTSFNQHKLAFWSFQHMCWGKVSVWVLPTAELFGRLRAVWHMHIECSNSNGSNLPVLERLAHAVFKYLDWTWQYSDMRQGDLAAILYFCDLCTRKSITISWRAKEKKASTPVFSCFFLRMFHRINKWGAEEKETS